MCTVWAISACVTGAVAWRRRCGREKPTAFISSWSKRSGSAVGGRRRAVAARRLHGEARIGQAAGAELRSGSAARGVRCASAHHTFGPSCGAGVCRRAAAARGVSPCRVRHEHLAALGKAGCGPSELSSAPRSPLARLACAERPCTAAVGVRASRTSLGAPSPAGEARWRRNGRGGAPRQCGGCMARRVSDRLLVPSCAAALFEVAVPAGGSLSLSPTLAGRIMALRASRAAH